MGRIPGGAKGVARGLPNPAEVLGLDPAGHGELWRV